MTKVEELQQKFEESLTHEFNGMLRGVLADFPSLIAAARAEGAEQERERIGVEGHLLRDCNSVLQIGGCSVLPTEEVSGIYERGVEEERERIRQEAIEHGCWSWQEEGGKMIQTVEIRADIIVPASLLAPATKEESK